MRRPGPSSTQSSDGCWMTGPRTRRRGEGRREEILLAAIPEVERDLAAMDRAASRPGTALERVRAVLRVYGPTGSATGWRLWIDGWALAQHEPVIAAHFRALEAHGRGTLRTLVDEGIADGTISCPDPD